MHAIVPPISKNKKHEEQREVGIGRSPDGRKRKLTFKIFGSLEVSLLCLEYARFEGSIVLYIPMSSSSTVASGSSSVGSLATTSLMDVF